MKMLLSIIVPSEGIRCTSSFILLAMVLHTIMGKKRKPSWGLRFLGVYIKATYTVHTAYCKTRRACTNFGPLDT